MLTCLRGYSRAHFARDLFAGLTLGVVALPLAMAFGIASIPENIASETGLSPPAVGLWTAVIAGFLISALGGTRVNIGGPTGAFVGIVYLIAAEHGYDGLLLATLLAGLILIIMGLARFGGLIKFIPYPVTTGFTSGIAVVIATGQVRDLLGLTMETLPPGFIQQIRAYSAHLGSIDPATTAIGVGTVIVIVAIRKWVTTRIPGPIVAILLASVLVRALELDVTTIGDRFGEISSAAPRFSLAFIDVSRVPELIGPATTIAILAAIESLLCAVVTDGMLGTRHRSNTELIAQGIANLASPIFGGIPATAAIARSATNVQSGGRTPIAGIIHAMTLLVILVALARYATMIPLASLAGVLMVVSYNMADIRCFRWLLSAPRSDTAVMLTTFGLTVLMDLSIAVQVGMVLAALLFMKRMADLTNVASISSEMNDVEGDATLAASGRAGNGRLPSDVQLYEIDGPFFFGAAYKMRDALDAISKPPRALILDLTKVGAIDATGLHALDELRKASVSDRTRLVLVGVHAQPIMAMEKAGMIDSFGRDAFAATIAAAIRLVEEHPDEHPGERAGEHPGEPEGGERG